MILNVLKHFETENSSSNENALVTLTFKLPRIVTHGVKSPSKIRPNRKKEFDKLDEFNLAVVRRMMHQLYARGESLANIVSLRPKFYQRFVKLRRTC